MQGLFWLGKKLGRGMPIKVAFYTVLIGSLNLSCNLLRQFFTITKTTLVLDLCGLLLYRCY